MLEYFVSNFDNTPRNCPFKLNVPTQQADIVSLWRIFVAFFKAAISVPDDF